MDLEDLCFSMIGHEVVTSRWQAVRGEHSQKTAQEKKKSSQRELSHGIVVEKG